MLHPYPIGPLPSLGPRLDSAKAKLRRANQQIRALKRSLDRLGKRDDIYRPGAREYDPGLAGWIPSREEVEQITQVGGIYLPKPIVRRRLFFSTIPLIITLTPVVDLSPQYLRWGILIGEIVHNIGSALDNLTWELAQPLPAQPDPSATNKVRNAYRRHLGELAFPFIKERQYWSNACDKYLYFIPDPVVRAVLEEAQPFYAWERYGTDPDTHALEIVHKLWNRDKHRTVNVSTAGLQFQLLRIRMPDFFPDVENLRSEVLEVLPLRPLEGETDMAKVLVHFPREVQFPRSRFYEMQVFVQPNFTLTILFGDGSPGEGLNALDELLAAHNLASQVIGKFS